MTLLPAPPDTGIVFRRTDLPDKPEIKASIENVVDTSRSTTLGKGKVSIHTVEHLLATISAFEIDNLYIELDANEPPIADGSARHFVKLIQNAGFELQSSNKIPLILTSPIQFEVGQTQMMAFPHDRLKISCTSSDRKGLFTQFYSVEVTPESFEKQIAHARTFCFFEEIEALIRNGLIKGGGLENAIVIRDDAVLTTEPLRYQDEFVRHKILDIIGDLSLLGTPLAAHIVAICPSHALNSELTRKIQAQALDQKRAIATFMPPPQSLDSSADADSVDVKDGKQLNINEILRLLPHRYPFLMVDRVLTIDGDSITAVKNVTVNEPQFLGHFPQSPIFPGVLQLEAIAQTAGILTLKRPENRNKLAYFMSAENVKWRRPVIPGDTLEIEVTMLRARGSIGRAKGVCKVNQKVVSEAEVTFMIVDNSKR